MNFPQELFEIIEHNGGEITPKLIVEAARGPDSPLHAAFEWDDSKAAECWRERCARDILVSSTR
jgi:hypothetical protein